MNASSSFDSIDRPLSLSSSRSSPARRFDNDRNPRDVDGGRNSSDLRQNSQQDLTNKRGSDNSDLSDLADLPDLSDLSDLSLDKRRRTHRRAVVAVLMAVKVAAVVVAVVAATATATTTATTARLCVRLSL